jgi:aminopeptidase N
MLKSRVGKDTRWDDLRAYFEWHSKPLGWFWNQWIDNADFPTLTMSTPVINGQSTRVTFHQTGTAKPFRLRFGVVLTNGKQSVEREVQMKSTDETFQLSAPFVIEKIEKDILGYTLVRVK